MKAQDEHERRQQHAYEVRFVTKQKNLDTLRRYSERDAAGIPPTAATIKHDHLAEAYRRGAVDAMRTVILAAQAALAKREGSGQ